MPSKSGNEPCADSAHVLQPVINPTTAARILMLASDPTHVREIGEAFPLLLHLLHACGTNDMCQLNLHGVAKRLNVSHTTTKSWVNSLVERGLVEKTVMGAKGICLKLNTDLFDEAVNFMGPTNPQERVIEQLAALRSVMNATLDGAVRIITNRDVAA